MEGKKRISSNFEGNRDMIPEESWNQLLPTIKIVM